MHDAREKAIEEAARRIVAGRGAETHARPDIWAEEVARFRERCAEYPGYENGSSLIHDAFRDARSALSGIDIGPPPAAGERFSIEHDGFVGTVVGHYTTLEGKRGVNLQQDGTRVVHVYGERWLRPAPPMEGPTHRHKKRGSSYRRLGDASGQVSTGIDDDGTMKRVVQDGTEITVYQAEDGRLFWRFPDEFQDGRFEELSGEECEP